MQKRKRNTVIAILSIVIVLITTGTTVIKTVGFDTIVSWIIPPSRSTQTPPDGQELTLTDPQSDYYDWDGSEVIVDRKGQQLYLKVTGVEVTKECGNLNLEIVQETANFLESNLSVDSSGNITNDYSYLKVSILVKNTFEDEYAAAFLSNNQIEYGIMGGKEAQSSYNVPGWLEGTLLSLISMTGENEQTDDDFFFVRDFAPGETREFVVGYSVKDEDLKKGNTFFYRVDPIIMDDDYYRDAHGLPDKGPSGNDATDNDLRYIYLNKYMEEWLK